MAEEETGGVCHHVYWLTLAELGWAGLALFLLVLARFAWKAAREMWRGDGGLAPMLQGAILFGSLALHASGFLEWAFRQSSPMLLYLLVAGVSVGMADRGRDRRDEGGEPEWDGGAPLVDTASEAA